MTKMSQKDARDAVNKNWRAFLKDWTGEAPRLLNGEASYICPRCHNGAHGHHGTGLTFYPGSKSDGLRCFVCGFSGDFIDLYMDVNKRPPSDYPRTVRELAAKMGIEVDDGDFKKEADDLDVAALEASAAKKREPLLKISIIDRDARTSKKEWNNISWTFWNFEKLFLTPTRSSWTLAKYDEASDDERKAEKGRAGGFIGGPLKGGVRNAQNVEGRSIWTGDVDNCPPAFFDLLKQGKGLPVRCFVYSTFSHRSDAPRLRVVAPFSRTVSPAEYKPLSEFIAAKIQALLVPALFNGPAPDNFKLFDEHGHSPAQLMYLPYVCKDFDEYFYQDFRGPVIDVDALFAEMNSAPVTVAPVMVAPGTEAPRTPAPEVVDDSDPEVQKNKEAIKRGRALINDPRATALLNARGLGLDPARRIFDPKYGLGFLPSYGKLGPGLMIQKGPARYLFRGQGPEDKRAPGGLGLYNEAALLTGDPVFVVEGEFDALSVIEVGDGIEAVALGGVEPPLIQKLCAFCREYDVRSPLIISLDTDERGQKATSLLVAALQAEGRRFCLNNISGPFKDPNERLVADREFFREIVKNAAQNARSLPLPIKEGTPTINAPVQASAPAVSQVAPGPVASVQVAPAVSQVAPAPPTDDAKKRPPTLDLVSLRGFVDEFSPGNWLVDKWVPADGLSMIFGPSGACKSFLALDIVLSLAARLETWNKYKLRTVDPGLDPREAPVIVYLAGEGYTGLRGRVLAWIQHHNDAGAEAARSSTYSAAIAAGADDEEATALAIAAATDFPRVTIDDIGERVFFSRRATDLYDGGQTNRAIEEIKALDRPVEFFVTDTLARFFRGDENSATDAGLMIANCQAIQNTFGGAFMWIHHSGVDPDAQERSRGSSAFKGALDTQINVVAEKQLAGGKIVVVRQTKQKDIDEEPALFFETQGVELDGLVNPETLETVKSAVLVPTDRRPSWWKKAERDGLIAAAPTPDGGPSNEDLLAQLN